MDTLFQATFDIVKEKVMRKSATFFLLFIFLLGALLPAQAEEALVELPFLLHHFQEHQKKVPESTFLDYLELHYGDQYTQHKSTHDHSKLPLKSNQVGHLHLTTPALPGIGLDKLYAPSLALTYEPHFIDQSYSHLLLQDIWQPPRCA